MAKPTDDPQIKTTLEPLAALTNDPDNRRTHSPRNTRMVRESLKAHGAGRSILLGDGNEIIAGENVATNAKALGFERVLVVETDGTTLVAVRRRGLTADQKRDLAIADNRTAETGEWDLDRLRADVKAGHNLGKYFSDKELAALLGDPPAAPGHTDPDACPEPRATSIKAGDVIKLGRHTLACGDCTNAETVAKLTGGTVRLVASDPPYCSGSFQEAGRSAGTWGDIASDTLSTRGFQSLMTRALEACRAQTVYLFTDWKMWIPLYDLVEAMGLAVRSHIVWDKGTPGLGALWRTQHELILFASRERNARIKGEPTIGNVIRCNRTGNKLHYTEKPVELMARIMGNDQSSERRKCPVLDPFAGSGTTMMAAEQLDRPATLIEVEPKLCQVIVDRFEAFTQQKAAKVGEVAAPTKRAGRGSTRRKA